MKVSVAMVAYNHEKFLAQALDSVLAQQVDFDYEIVLGEDCSTDNTRDIARQYQADHPDRIRLILREKNVGAWQNNEEVLDACRGEYIAFLEGDDFWIHPEKLRRQTAYMDAHPNCAVSGHRVRVWPSDEPESAPRENWTICPPEMPAVLPFNYLIKHYMLYTAATMIRSKFRRPLPDWSQHVLNGDFVRDLLSSAGHDVGFLNDVMATYRVHSGGFWNGKTARVRRDGAIRTYHELHKELDREYHGQLKDQIGVIYRDYGWWALRDRDDRFALECALRAIRSRPASGAAWRLLACTLLKRRPAS